MNFKKNVLIVFVSVLVFGGLLTGCAFNKKAATNPTAVAIEQKTIEYQGEEGKTAFDILKANHQVESQDSSLGVMVNSIDDLKSTDKDFWLYSVNGAQPSVAADKYQTKSSDSIKWEYKGM
ncbi:MAG: DUF4430 domain-containing protein [Candidatus Berkelbacteria bacterium]|nr:DUF4430 domain-containing protein [Candidatus Berkelbacteria bacterium]